MNEKVYPRIGERVLEKTLPNGLKIFIVPKPQHRKKYAFFAKYAILPSRMEFNNY